MNLGFLPFSPRALLEVDTGAPSTDDARGAEAKLFKGVEKVHGKQCVHQTSFADWQW